MSPRRRPRPPRLRAGQMALAVTTVGLGALGHGLLLVVLACVVAATLVLLTAIAAIRVRYLPTLGVTVALLAFVQRGRSPDELSGLAALGVPALAEPTRPMPAVPAPEESAAPAAEVEKEGAARRRFADFLTPAEMTILRALARREAYPAGAVLCRENQWADRVIVIEQGTVKVSIDAAGTDRQIALRGPGDLIGERAMMLVKKRSATVVALTDVHALVAPAGEFNAFLDEHSHLVAVLERQFYDRLTHDAAAPAAQEAPETQGNLNGEFRAVLFADVVEFGGLYRTDTDRLAVRDATYGALREAFERSGIPIDACHWEDRGDGALIILPAAQPPHLVLHPLPVHVAAALRRHNRGVRRARRVCLRLALDIGPVTADAHGVNGTAIIHAARLLNAAEFKRRMAATGAELGVAVSGHVYDSVVRHAPGQVDPADYRRIDIAEKETRAAAWVALAGLPQRSRNDGCDGRPPERRRPLRPGGPPR